MNQNATVTITAADATLPARAKTAHKGDFGHILIIGGEQGFSGALLLAGMAALRSGAGRVSLATRATHASVLNLAHPELMVHAVEQATTLRPLIKQADFIVIGPGLGQSSWAQDLLAIALESRQPLLVDADGLNLLAKEPYQRDNWILTPHPGEAARLAQTDIKQIQTERLQAVQQLAVQYSAITVLKGAGSLIAAAQPAAVAYCDIGNPGMATAGMGDLLTGIIAALATQGLDLFAAARAGVWIHAQAGDLAAAANGERGLIATDLLPYIRQLVNRK